MPILSFLLIIFLVEYTVSKTKEEWKSRSIYQILTDRFARSVDTGGCDLNR